MTPAGRRVELARYRITAGQRALYAQRIDGRVAVVDVPIDHAHLVERHVHSRAELSELTAAYCAHSQDADQPAIVAERALLNGVTEAL